MLLNLFLLFISLSAIAPANGMQQPIASSVNNTLRELSCPACGIFMPLREDWRSHPERCKLYQNLPETTKIHTVTMRAAQAKAVVAIRAAQEETAVAVLLNRIQDPSIMNKNTVNAQAPNPVSHKRKANSTNTVDKKAKTQESATQKPKQEPKKKPKNVFLASCGSIFLKKHAAIKHSATCNRSKPHVRN